MAKRRAPGWFYANSSTSTLPGLHTGDAKIKAELGKLQDVQTWLRKADSYSAINRDFTYGKTSQRSNEKPSSQSECLSPRWSRSNKLLSLSHSVPANTTEFRQSAQCLSSHTDLKQTQLNEPCAFSINGDIACKPETKPYPAHLPHFRRSQRNVLPTGTVSRDAFQPGLVLRDQFEPDSVTEEEYKLGPIPRKESYKLGPVPREESYKLGSVPREESYKLGSVPREVSLYDYTIKKRRTFYGKENSFTRTLSFGKNTHYRSGFGPIQRPHTPLTNVLERQISRYGDPLLHTKSNVKDVTDQRGRTYSLHSKLKDMLTQ